MSDNIEEKTPIELPFEEEKFDIGPWAYDHHVGLLTTLIIYLLLAIAFMTVKISLEIKPQYNTISVDLQELAELERQRDEMIKSVEVLQQQTQEWEDVQNKASNEAAEEHMPDDLNTDVNQLMEDAAEYQRQMASNRAAYESGVAEAQAIRDNWISSVTPYEGGSLRERRDRNLNGNVTVSYSFAKPIRHAQILTVPAYQCEGGGEVVISVVLNRNGVVTSAKIVSGGDECMQQTALSAAQSSRFNIDRSAPNRHFGIISYIFVPQ